MWASRGALPQSREPVLRAAQSNAQALRIIQVRSWQRLSFCTVLDFQNLGGRRVLRVHGMRIRKGRDLNPLTGHASMAFDPAWICFRTSAAAHRAHFVAWMQEPE